MRARGYILLFFGLLFGGVLFSQAQRAASPKKPVDVKADVAYRTPKLRDKNAIVMVGNVVFHHNGAAISCDSAVRYSDRRIDCFKNVIINQGSSYVYGDRAEYNGDAGLARVYSPVVKVIDGDATLYTYNFSFNTRTKVGTWFGGGVMYQKDNVLESEKGYYYSDRRELVAVRAVEMKNNSHKITSDSVRYNTATRVASFYTKTYIWTRDGEIISADLGRYNTRDSTYFFYRNAYILTEFRETWADTIDFRAKKEDGFFYGNIQIDDRENSSSAFGDYAQYWGERGETMLTKMPSLSNYNEDQEGDTLYMRSDTIFMFVRYPSDTPGFNFFAGDTPPDEASQRSVVEDSLLDAGMTDTLAAARLADSLTRLRLRGDSLLRADSLVRVDSIRTADPKAYKKLQKTEKARLKAEKKRAKARAKAEKRAHKARLREEKQRAREEKYAVKDSIRQARAAAKAAELEALQAERRRRKAARMGWVMETAYSDSLAIADMLRQDSLSAAQIDSIEQLTKLDTTAAAPKERDTVFRIIRGWRNVRVWRRDTQAVCDSMVAYSLDSTMHMYVNPVLWYDKSQVVSDSITAFAVGGEIHRAEFYGNPIMSSEVDSKQYNQAKGRTMTAFFRDGGVYRHDIYGNAESIYYMQEDDDPTPVALLVATSSDMTFLIEDKMVRYIVARENVDWPVYPMDQIPQTQPTLMKGFRWYADRRPERRDVFTRRVRVSERDEYLNHPMPEFPIAARILKRREYLISNRMWGDRTDPLPAHAAEFVRSLK